MRKSSATKQSTVLQTFGLHFSPTALTKPFTPTMPGMTAAAPSVRYDKKNDRYGVSFYDDSPTKRVIYGRSSARTGSIVTPLVNIAESPSQARDPSMFAFGDRILFVYADDRDQNDGYELYTREMSADLTRQSATHTRHGDATGDSVEPILSFAADGTVLVLFRDDRGPTPAVFETASNATCPCEACVRKSSESLRNHASTLRTSSATSQSSLKSR